MSIFRGQRLNQPVPDAFGSPPGGLAGDVVQRRTIADWLTEHEDAQMVAAVLLMIFGAWWLLRGILTIIINLALPLLLIMFAVMYVPGLRDPVLGDSYPALAAFLRRGLLKLADLLKTP